MEKKFLTEFITENEIKNEMKYANTTIREKKEVVEKETTKSANAPY